nr:hypothetical protein CFP56_72711 [Quercus suber]
MMLEAINPGRQCQTEFLDDQSIATTGLSISCARSVVALSATLSFVTGPDHHHQSSLNGSAKKHAEKMDMAKSNNTVLRLFERHHKDARIDEVPQALL